MHMPGHKRNPDFIDPEFYGDITEIDGFDNLHSPSGILRDTEAAAADVWSGKYSVMSVNGATAPILAAVTAASSGGKILVASNCHISVWHALELSDARFEYIDPEVSPALPFFLRISPDKVRRCIEEDPDIKAVIITSPTYEGIVSDTREIYKVTDMYGIPLIVDEAHGSHFGLDPFFPDEAKADIVIKGLHKTLHAPTQTALLIGYTDKIPEDIIRHYMDIFETTSPSYVLMSGLSRAINDISGNRRILKPWIDAIKTSRGYLTYELRHLELFSCSDKDDPSKLVILTQGVIDGRKLSGLLREWKIEIEAAFDTHIIAMTGIGDTSDTVAGFVAAISEIDDCLEGQVVRTFNNPLPSDKPVLKLSSKEAVHRPSITLPKGECEGKTCAGYIFKYPPGIPILIPGQIITRERIELTPCDNIKVISDLPPAVLG